MLINHLSLVTFPVQIVYIGGTIGVSIGADLTNLYQVAGIDSVAEIGGADTLDGVYITGIVTMLLSCS